MDMGNGKISRANNGIPERTAFSLVNRRDAVLALHPQIVALADSEKNDALGFLSDSAIREAILRDRVIALATGEGDDNSLVGYVLYSGVFPHAKVQQIATNKAWRRSGAATALMNSLVSKLERQGFLSIRADIAEDLAASLSFYLKNGFVQAFTRPGGSARKRAILAHVRELETDSLFTFADRQASAGTDLGIRQRSAGDDPIYAFDLNVYFDLVRERAESEKARRLFGAALSHEIRLVVAEEFVVELRRTSPGQSSDPVLQMALRMPRLPKADATALTGLTTKIHGIVFVQTGSPAAGTKQSMSDAGHLAHAALSRASAFITRDSAMLDARDRLLEEVGIDVISLDETVALLPPEPSDARFASHPGVGFKFALATEAEVKAYFTEIGITNGISSEFTQTQAIGVTRQVRAIRDDRRLHALAVLVIPRGMKPVARLLVHARADHVDAGLFADFLLDQMTREACAGHPILIELVHVAGQSTVNSIAQSRGFARTKSGDFYRKLAVGMPVTQANWSESVAEVRRRTDIAMPGTMPASSRDGQEISLVPAIGPTQQVRVSQLPDVLGPVVFVWPDRDGVVVPIARDYANALLGTNPQQTFDFVENRDAAFLTRRAYVNAPRSAKIMPLEAPILFYESKRSGGRGAVVAVARIVDRVLISKSELPNDGQRRLVVDDVDAFSATDDVLFTTFDNVFPLPVPVPLSYLKAIGATGSANLISAVSLSGEKITKILTQGWLRESR
ncbi:MAG: GNAT family N-acetyltransferase [Sphingorhabdus sp.]|nr:GNAT family N-acetyltransferase [Sphingorhabdus sp.]